MKPNSLEPQDIAIETADHIKLAGTYYPCSNSSSAVLICPATGIGQKSYADFARWLNEEGFAVLTFDYRGTGDSLFGIHVKDSQAKKHEWGQHDMTAALAYLSERHPDNPVHVIGHNIAGVLMGLMPNHAKISGAVSVGGSSFYVSEMAGITRFIANLFFSFYIPLCLTWFGYVPLKCFGREQDIPAGVAKQWARWCLYPGHIRNSFGVDIKKHFYRDFHSPILVLYTDHDPVTDHAGIEDMSDLYRSATVEYKKIVSKDYGFKEIRHLNFFKPKYAKLWLIIADWFRALERQQIVKTSVPEIGPQLVVGVSPAHPKVNACACTRTRLKAQQISFVGTGNKKVKVVK